MSCEALSVDIRYLPQIGLATEKPVLQGFFWRLSPIYFFCRISVARVSPTWSGELKSSPIESHAGERYTYGGVLPGAPKWSFATLLSPPQYHAAFGTMPYTLASVDQSPVCRHMTLLLRDEDT
jgi:hypothetical protein